MINSLKRSSKFTEVFLSLLASALRAMSIVTHVMLYCDQIPVQPITSQYNCLELLIPHSLLWNDWSVLNTFLTIPMHALMTWTAVNLWKWPPQLVQQTADYLFNTQTMPEETLPNHLSSVSCVGAFAAEGYKARLNQKQMPVPQTFQSGQAAITRIICQQCQQKKEGQRKWQHSWGWDSASCWPRQGRVWTAKVWTISLLVAFVTSHAAFFSDQHLFGEGQRQRLERWVTGCPGEKTMEKAPAHCLIFFLQNPFYVGVGESNQLLTKQI